MSAEHSENSEQDGSNFTHSEGELSGHSASGQSVSLSLKSSDIFGAFRFQDIFLLLRKFWYIIFLGVFVFTTVFFLFSLTPPPFEAETVLRIRAVTGKNKVNEAISIKGEEGDLRSPDLIRIVLRSLNRPTVVRPVDSVFDELSYFLEKRKASGLIAAMQPDKFSFDLRVFEVTEEEGTYYVSSTGTGSYILYDQDFDEILQGRFGVLMEDLDVKIQVDGIHGQEGQMYELKYLSEDEMVSWAVEGIKTWREGKDGKGGAIRLSFFTYDKVLLTRFLNTMGKEHVLNTERRLQKGTVKALKDKKDKLMFIEQDLFKMERELERLQRANAATGNLATSASELRQQATMAEKERLNLEFERDDAEEKYKDLRTVFAPNHPLVKSAQKNLARLELSIEEINKSTEGVPELLMKIQNIEESLESTYKEKQLLDEEVSKIEAIRKGSKSYISVSQEAQIKGNKFTEKPPRMATLGVLSGFISSILLIVIANLRVVKTLTLEGDYSAFSDGNSVDIENEGSTKSSSQFLSLEGDIASYMDQEEYSSQDADLLFQDYSSEMDSVSMYMSEASSPSELDSPNVHSVETSVVDLDSNSVMGADMSFLEENFIPEEAILIATGVWSSKSFSDKGLRTIQYQDIPILEVVNNTETSVLKALIVYARSSARQQPTLLIDMQTDESSCSSFHKVESRNGFWDVLSKRASLKGCLLQTSHRYFILPAGKYSPEEIRMHRIVKLIEAVQKKFSRIIILHSQDTVIWRSIRTQLKEPGLLLWLQADYSLYRIGRLPQPEENQVISLGDVLYQLWDNARVIRVWNEEGYSMDTLKTFLDYHGKGKVLLIEACSDGRTLFPSITTLLRISALLDGTCSLKDAIHEISSSLYVIPGSPFSQTEKRTRLESLIRQVSQKFSRVLILQDKKTAHQKNEAQLILRKDGTVQVLDTKASQT